MIRRLAAAAGAVCAAGLLMAAPAGATIDPPNTIGCAGSATITDPDGKVYQADAADAVVEVPNEGTANWQGSIATVTHNHSGKVNLELGPMTVQLGKWGPSENSDDESSSSGVEEIPSIVRLIPPGKYVVSGDHSGDEGGCSGRVIVDVQASAFGPISLVVHAGAVASAAAVGFAAKGKKP